VTIVNKIVSNRSVISNEISHPSTSISNFVEVASNLTSIEDCDSYLLRYKNHENSINIMNYNISVIRFKLISNLEDIYKFLANYYIGEKNLDVLNSNADFKLLRGYVGKHIKNLLEIDKKTERRKYKCLFRIKFLIDNNLITNINELVKADLNITYISEIDNENFNVFVKTLSKDSNMVCDVNQQFKILINNNNNLDNNNVMLEN
jgi:hypothetical protein